VRIHAITPERKHETVYNLSVANTRTFFVGEEGVLVHNNYCTKTGVKRDSRKHWREQQGRSDLSEENLKRIRGQKSPKVDDQWISHHPEHAPYKGETIEVHHVNYGTEVREMPTTLHRGPGNYKENHPLVKNVRRVSIHI
jgi:hypothetical protein